MLNFPFTPFFWVKYIFFTQAFCALFLFYIFLESEQWLVFLCFFCHFLLFLAIIGLSVCTHFYSVCYYKVFFSWPQRSIMKLSAGYTSFYFFFHAFCVASVPASFDGLNPIRISGVFVFVCVCVAGVHSCVTLFHIWNDRNWLEWVDKMFYWSRQHTHAAQYTAVKSFFSSLSIRHAPQPKKKTIMYNILICRLILCNYHY